MTVFGTKSEIYSSFTVVLSDNSDGYATVWHTLAELATTSRIATFFLYKLDPGAEYIIGVLDPLLENQIVLLTFLYSPIPSHNDLQIFHTMSHLVLGSCHSPLDPNSDGIANRCVIWVRR